MAIFGRKKQVDHHSGSLEAIDPARLPKHVAIIMDGNGRWAKLAGNSESPT